MREKINLFEPEETPARIHIGLRMIKTAVAVFLCSIVGFLRGQSAIFAMFAAVACMQSSAGKTLETSFNQVLGTVVGAIFGLAVLLLEHVTSMRDMMLLYYLICSLMLIPIILFTLLIKKPSISSFACAVFLGIAVYQLDTEQPAFYAIQRTADILLGVVVAFLVNIALPNRSLTHESGVNTAAAMGAQESKDEAAASVSEIDQESKNKDVVYTETRNEDAPDSLVGVSDTAEESDLDNDTDDKKSADISE